MACPPLRDVVVRKAPPQKIRPAISDGFHLHIPGRFDAYDTTFVPPCMVIRSNLRHENIFLQQLQELLDTGIPVIEFGQAL
jgi:hypothetical protein